MFDGVVDSTKLKDVLNMSFGDYDETDVGAVFADLAERVLKNKVSEEHIVFYGSSSSNVPNSNTDAVRCPSHSSAVSPKIK